MIKVKSYNCTKVSIARVTFNNMEVSMLINWVDLGLSRHRIRNETMRIALCRLICNLSMYGYLTKDGGRCLFTKLAKTRSISVGALSALIKLGTEYTELSISSGVEQGIIDENEYILHQLKSLRRSNKRKETKDGGHQ